MKMQSGSRWNFAVRFSCLLLLCLAMGAICLGPRAYAQGNAKTSSPSITAFNAPAASSTPCNNAGGTVAQSINGSGESAGYYYDANGVAHGFLRSGDGSLTSFDVPGVQTTGTFGDCGLGTLALSINTAGAIVGVYTPGQYQTAGFIRAADGTFTTFQVTIPGVVASLTPPMSINDSGAVAGDYTDNQDSAVHSFLRAPDGTVTTIDDPNESTGPGDGTFASSINNSGLVVGIDYSIDGAGQGHGFLRTPDGNFTDFVAPNVYNNGVGCGGSPPCNGTAPTGINSTGTIVGYYMNNPNRGFRGFIRAADGTFTEFDAPGAASSDNFHGTYPMAINDSGTIIGFYTDANDAAHGFVRSASGAFTTFDVPGAASGFPSFLAGSNQGVFSDGGSLPLSVNASNQFAGFYTDANGVMQGFVGTTPPPTKGHRGKAKGHSK